MKTKFILGMRDAFFDALFEHFARDTSAVFVTADCGAPSLDKYSDTFPERFLTVGIAEQQLIGMTCGLALEGKKVYAYAIAPFISIRCLEQIKLDVCAMELPVVLVAVGAGYAYDIMGPTHHAADDITVLRVMPNLVIHSPADGVAAAAMADATFLDPRPQYIRFDRAGIPDLYRGRDVDFGAGIVAARAGGGDLVIAATGIMVHQALHVAENLTGKGLDATVLDICRLKPINRELLLQHAQGAGRLVTMEEHLLAGGMGSAVLECLADAGVMKPVLRFGQDDRFVFDLGGREAIWNKYGLAVDAMTNRIAKWMGL